METQLDPAEGASDGSRPSGRDRRTAIAVVVAGVVVALVGFLAFRGALDSGDQLYDEVARQRFEAQVGIRITTLSVTAGGGMLDLRYRVLDPDKALTMHDGDYYAVFGGDEAEAPQLIDEDSGTVAIVPWMSHTEDEAHTGVAYHLILWNPDGEFEPGDRATLKVGDAVLEHVPVQ